MNIVHVDVMVDFLPELQVGQLVDLALRGLEAEPENAGLVSNSLAVFNLAAHFLKREAFLTYLHNLLVLGLLLLLGVGLLAFQHMFFSFAGVKPGMGLRLPDLVDVWGG